MKSLTYFLFFLFCIFAGILFFAIQNELIIFNLSTVQKINQRKPANKKQVNLIFWQNNQWKTETHDLLWTNNKQQDLRCLINAWLTLLHEENIMEKKVTLHTVLLAASDQVAYFSFDSAPLPKESATIVKLLFIEGLLKTIRENNITLQEIQFLVQHELLEDPHLDFSKSWPINGFLQEQKIA